MGSWKSPLNSSDSSCARAFRAITVVIVSHQIPPITCDGDRGLTLESLLDVDGLLGARLKVRDPALGLAERHRALSRDDALALLNVDLVPENHLLRVLAFITLNPSRLSGIGTYKGEVVRVPR